MGVLDTCILIDAERSGQGVLEILEQIRPILAGPAVVERVRPVLVERIVDPDIGVAVVTIAELEHGVYRAEIEHRRLEQLRFIGVLSQAVACTSRDCGDRW